MSSDLRFHIASLAAVFLALGIGILVGTAFVGAPLVERQTRFFIRNLDTNLQKLDTRVGELQRETQEAVRNEEALRALLPRLVAGKLAGQPVLVVQTGDYADAAERAAEALRLAGALVTRVELSEDAWRRRASSEMSGDSPSPPLLATPGTKAEGDAERVAAGAERLAPLLVSGQPSPVLDAFRREGLVSGEVPENAARFVALVGGAKAVPGPEGPATADGAAARGRALDASLARAWQAAGVTVVGAEPLRADVSFMPAYQALGIATVDNIDRAAGQIALPYALAGEKAAYGMKLTADRVLPASLERPAEAPAPERP